MAREKKPTCESANRFVFRPHLENAVLEDARKAVHSTTHSRGGTHEYRGRRQFLVIAPFNVVAMNGGTDAKGAMGNIQSKLEGAPVGLAMLESDGRTTKAFR